MRRVFNIRSLPAQMILSFVGVIILTAAIAGLPAIWLIREQFEKQAWSQVFQGVRAAQALYAATRSELANFATLTAERPTLRDFVDDSDQTELLGYLQRIQTVAELDLVAVCRADNQAIAAMVSPVPESLCQNWLLSGYHLVERGDLAQVWLTESHPITVPGGSAGTVIVGKQLDVEFARLMRAETGFEHTLLVRGRSVASSFTAEELSIEPLGHRSTPCEGIEELECSTFHLDGRPYYAARTPLGRSDLELELALPVAGSTGTQRHLVWVLALSTLGVALTGSIIGVLLARRISQPLVRLAKSATSFSEGDLSSSLDVEARVHEVVQVSQTLEGARKDLLTTLTNLRKEKNWINHLLESIIEGIVTLDNYKRITFFSHGAERITGWSRKSVLNRDCDQIFKLAQSNVPFSKVT